MITKYIEIIPRSVVKNKKRTISIAVSIVFTVMLITSVEIFLRGIVNASLKENGEQGARYFASYTGIYYDDISKLKQDDRIDSIGLKSLLGNHSTDSNTITLAGIDQETIYLLNYVITEGRYPERESEILIENTILKKMFPDKKLGDKMKLKFLIQRNIDNRIVENEETFEFTVCGVIENRSSIKGIDDGVIYIDQNYAEKLVQQKEMIYSCYFTTKKELPVRDTIENFNDKFITEFNVSEMQRFINRYQINSFIVNTMENYQNSRKTVFSVDIIIALASAVLLYNMFNISISERVKSFGLLKSVGITPGQMKILILGEAVFLGLITVPIGIVLGVKGVGLIIGIIGGIGNRKLVVDSDTYSAFTIVTASFVSIIVASLKPAVIASKISPLQALITNNKILVKDKRNNRIIETFINRILGYTGKLAIINLARNKKRFLATVISISVGFMIFIGMNYFIDSIDPIKQAKAGKESDFILSITNSFGNVGYSHYQIEEIKNIPGVKTVKSYKELIGTICLKPEYITKFGLDEIEPDKGIYNINIHLIGVSSEELSKLRLVEYADKPTAFILQEKNYRKVVDLPVGYILDVGWMTVVNSDYIDIKGKFIYQSLVDKFPYNIKRYEKDVVLLTNQENLVKLFGLTTFQRISIDVNKDADILGIESRLKTIVQQQKKAKISSFREDLENLKKAKSEITVVLYGLFMIVVIFSLVNIVNTISLNILTRVNEFGILRAIGMTKGQLRSVIIKEGFIYGLTGSLIGGTLGIFFSYLIYKAANGRMIEEMKWFIRFDKLTIAFFAAILASIISTLIPLRKATKLDIVESIKSVE